MQSQRSSCQRIQTRSCTEDTVTAWLQPKLSGLGRHLIAQGPTEVLKKEGEWGALDITDIRLMGSKGRTKSDGWASFCIFASSLIICMFLTKDRGTEVCLLRAMSLCRKQVLFYQKSKLAGRDNPYWCPTNGSFLDSIKSLPSSKSLNLCWGLPCSALAVCLSVCLSACCCHSTAGCRPGCTALFLSRTA